MIAMVCLLCFWMMLPKSFLADNVLLSMKCRWRKTSYDVVKHEIKRCKRHWILKYVLNVQFHVETIQTLQELNNLLVILSLYCLTLDFETHNCVYWLKEGLYKVFLQFTIIKYFEVIWHLQEHSLMFQLFQKQMRDIQYPLFNSKSLWKTFW